MAGSKSDDLENLMLDTVLGGPDYVRPGTVYIELYTVAPTDAGGGTAVTGGSYVRKAVTNNDTTWPNAAGSLKQNGTAITFIQATANWGTVVAFAIFDAVSAGDFSYWGDLTVSKSVDSGDTAEFAIGGISITED